ncbi:MAG: aspartyl protease family protein [Planctomycetaceae bacterium]
MKRRRALPLLLLAACAAAHRNDRLIAELEERAEADPRPELARVSARWREPVRWASPISGATLPMLDGWFAAVRGSVEGRPMDLLLDTGTSCLHLSGPAARRVPLHLPAGKPLSLHAAGYEALARAGAVESVELGPLRFGPAPALLEVNETLLRAEPEYALVGCSILSHFRATFDYAGREVRLVPHGGPGSCDPLFAKAIIDGRPFRLMVDTGAKGVFLEPWAALELGLIDATEAERRKEGAGSRADVRFPAVILDRIAVAGREFRDVRARVVRVHQGEGPDGPAGLLGLSEFGPLSWTLDYDARRLTVEG